MVEVDGEGDSAGRGDMGCEGAQGEPRVGVGPGEEEEEGGGAEGFGGGSGCEEGFEIVLGECEQVFGRVGVGD